ncbi:hypothetical protein, partial [Symbiobacterium thermophilum]|uniref:hypothetical protein n=1 Tax=Symbiobacterium thermophilum TaxID=2734 RepID=UPI002354FF02
PFGEKEKNKLFKKCLDQLFKQAVMVNSHTFTSHAKIHMRCFDNICAKFLHEIKQKQRAKQ